ncbi:glycosyltransferase family 2 protein [Paraburkholderia caribensis]|uniref:glycosyltransferase family 2 protein n=1 Tax=Paraburkholderia caribensis TaxID=75105 RepID=UPI000B2F947D|nr:glycosyltransferase family A protein [Paraburkholderia caribensis]
MRQTGENPALVRPHDLSDCIEEPAPRQTLSSSAPLVTVVMANFNGEKWIGKAIQSMKEQRLTDWELIVVDDASTDASVEVVRSAAADDPRVVLLTSLSNAGPSAARNRALLQATGRWITILDSDDLLAEERLESLVKNAESDGVAIAADDLLIVTESGSLTGHSLLDLRTRRIFDAVELVETPRLGYLKPVIKAELLSGVRYDERMRWAEDFDLLLRTLVKHDARVLVYPPMGYHYRRRDGSLSTDKSADRQSLVGMMDATARFVASHPISARLADACARRRRSLETSLRWVDVTEAVHQKRLAAAVRYAIDHPQVLRCALQFARKRLNLLLRADKRRAGKLWL